MPNATVMKAVKNFAVLGRTISKRLVFIEKNSSQLYLIGTVREHYAACKKVLKES